MAVQTANNIKWLTQSDQQVFCCTLANVADADTLVIPGIAYLTAASLTPNTSASVGISTNYSSGVYTVTFKVSTGTPSLICKFTGLI